MNLPQGDDVLIASVSIDEPEDGIWCCALTFFEAVKQRNGVLHQETIVCPAVFVADQLDEFLDESSTLFAIALACAAISGPSFRVRQVEFNFRDSDGFLEDVSLMGEPEEGDGAVLMNASFPAGAVPETRNEVTIEVLYDTAQVLLNEAFRSKNAIE